jgi:hypothetical protein
MIVSILVVAVFGRPTRTNSPPRERRYCTHCGAQVDAPVDCQSEVLLELTHSRFDKYTGRPWYQKEISLAIGGPFVVFAICEIHHHVHTVFSEATMEPGKLSDRLRPHRPTIKYTDGDVPIPTVLQFFDPPLRRDRFLALGPCRIPLCPRCGERWSS